MNYFLNFIISQENVILGLLNLHQLLAASILLFIEESGIPLPVPGDVIISYIGYKTSIGQINLIFAFFSLFISIILGSSLLYFISHIYGKKIILKAGKLLGVDEEKYDQVQKSFRRYGIIVIIFGRHIPGFRIPITIFSGSFKVGYFRFISSVAVSIVFWIIFYLWLGRTLGPETINLLHRHNGFYLFGIVPFVVFVVYLLIRFKKSK